VGLIYSRAIPLDLKQRLEAFVPPPIPTTLASAETQPTTYQIQNNYRHNRRDGGKNLKDIPVAIAETESAALSELFTVL
jgi:hypothetical protein